MRLSFALLTSALISLAAFAHADTTYTYTGQPFTSVSNDAPAGVPPAYTTSGYVTGFFTTASPLAGGLHDASIAPVAFSFTDGVNTFDNTLSFAQSSFAVSTNAAGVLTAWAISNVANANFIFVDGGPDAFTAPGDSVFADQVGSASNNVSGSFTANTPAPEPESLALLGTGAFGLVGVLRRRFVA